MLRRLRLRKHGKNGKNGKNVQNSASPTGVLSPATSTPSTPSSTPRYTNNGTPFSPSSLTPSLMPTPSPTVTQTLAPQTTTVTRNTARNTRPNSSQMTPVNAPVNAPVNVRSYPIKNKAARAHIGRLAGMVYDTLEEMYGGDGALANQVYGILHEHHDAIVSHLAAGPRQALNKNPAIKFLLSRAVVSTAKKVYTKEALNKTLGVLAQLPTSSLLKKIVDITQRFLEKKGHRVPLDRIRRVVTRNGAALQSFIRNKTSLKSVVLDVVANELTDAEVWHISRGLDDVRDEIVFRASKFIFDLFHIPENKRPQSVLQR